MHRPVPILGVGSIEVRPGDAGGGRIPVDRLKDAENALGKAGKRIRLFHRIEEVAFLAAWDALMEGGISVPVEDHRAGIALGVDEGIDGIRARHSLALRDGGPMAVSPLSFPFTSHNAVTAQLSIFLDLRGEYHTFCGGSLAGATAVGAGRRLVLDGHASFVLAGGATSVEKEFLERGIDGHNEWVVDSIEAGAVHYKNGEAAPFEVICYGADGKPGGEGINADIRSDNLK